MFKKDLKFSSQNILSGKDKKSLTNTMMNSFEQESVSKIMKIFEKLSTNKLKGSNIRIIKDEHNNSILVDATGKGDIFPSIQLVEAFPDLVKRVEVKEGVEKFILNGANLMWPGVKQVEQGVEQDQVVKVLTSKQQVVAIGALAQPTSTNPQEGVAVYILTYLHDPFYNHQPSTLTHPKLSSIQHQIHNQKEKEEEEQEEQEEKEQKECKKKKEEEEESENENEQQIQSDNQQMMDEYLMEGLLNALTLEVKDKDLPMDPSVLYSLLLTCKNPHVSIDIKQSSFKKVGKFFQAVSKDKDKLLDYKMAKKATQPLITKIYRNAPRYLQWTPTIHQALQKEEGQKKQQDYDHKLICKVDIQEVYKVKKDYQEVIILDKPTLTLVEARAGLLDYCNRNELVDKRVVTLDPLLAKLFATKEQPTHINKDQLVGRVTEALQEYYIVQHIQTATREVKAGKFKGVHMIAEKSRNKNITKIQGLELFHIDIPLMSNYLQIKFACSSTVNETQGKSSTGKEIVIQGKFINELTDLFVNESQIPKKYITSEDKLSKKKK